MNKDVIKKQRKNRRAARTRANIFGTAAKPRLSVFRSLKHISVQLIDDDKKQTIASASDKELKGTKAVKAKEVGKLIAKKALEAKIKKIIFDKGSYKYQGRVQAVADGAREGGLEF